MAEGAPPGWGRIAPRTGAGCCRERGSQGSWLRWGRTLDFALAQARAAAGRVRIDKGLARGIGAGVGQRASGSLRGLPPRSAATSTCLEAPATAGAETDGESRAASSRLRTPLVQSPARPSPPRPSSRPCSPPLRSCSFACLPGWARARS